MNYDIAITFNTGKTICLVASHVHVRQAGNIIDLVKRFYSLELIKRIDVGGVKIYPFHKGIKAS